MLKNCLLFRDREQRDAIFEWLGPIVGDVGFRSQLLPSIITPICSRKTAAGRELWQYLHPEERLWSARIGAIEARIENLYADVFVNKFQLLKRRPQGCCKNGRGTLPRLLIAACIIYNMQIDDRSHSFLGDL